MLIAQPDILAGLADQHASVVARLSQGMCRQLSATSATEAQYQASSAGKLADSPVHLEAVIRAHDWLVPFTVQDRLELRVVRPFALPIRDGSNRVGPSRRP